MDRRGALAWLPPNGWDKSKPKPKVGCEIKWQTEVLEEGQPKTRYGGLRGK